MKFTKIGDRYQITCSGQELAVLIGFNTEDEMNAAANEDYGKTDMDAIHSVMCDVLTGIEDIVLVD